MLKPGAFAHLYDEFTLNHFDLEIFKAFFLVEENVHSFAFSNDG
jgi:hypothetical protein